MKKVTNIYQLNLNRSPTAALTLTANHHNFHCISLVQEPPVKKDGNIYAIPAPLQILAIDKYPRAAIIYNPSLDIWPISLSDRDCQVALWQTKGNKIMLISAYWHARDNSVINTIEKALKLAKNKRYSILMGIDCNGHHPS